MRRSPVGNPGMIQTRVTRINQGTGGIENIGNLVLVPVVSIRAAGGGAGQSRGRRIRKLTIRVIAMISTGEKR